jgi:hypothetical protein
MGIVTKSLYETDFAEWTAQVAELLRRGRLDAIATAHDLSNLAEEIEDLGKNQRVAVRSQLVRLQKHMIKQKIQPDRAGSSWLSSIADARIEISLHLEDSPSLRRYLVDTLDATWQKAVRAALTETRLVARAKQLDLPVHCPCTLDELLESDLEELWPHGRS